MGVLNPSGWGAPCGAASPATETRACLQALGAEANTHLVVYLDAAQAEATQMTVPPVSLARAQAR